MADEATILTEDEKEFQGAFAEAAKEQDAKVEPKDEIPSAAKDEVEVEDKGKGDDQPAETMSDEQAKESETAPSPDQAEQRYLTLQGIHKADKEKWEADRAAMEAKLLELQNGSGTPQKSESTETGNASKAKGEEAADPLADLSDAEKDFLAEYEEDYDIVSKAEAIKRKVEIAQLEKRFTSTLTALVKAITPVIESVAESKKEDHFSAIEKAHKDYDQHVKSGAIAKWIGSKPQAEKEGLLKDYQQGSADQVINLITKFKTENKITTRPKDKESDLEAMRGVKGGKHNAVQFPVGGGNDVDDFVSAFREAAANIR